MTPIASGITDINGTVSFEQLISGLYLITGAIDIEENHIYTPTPFLVAVTNGAITATVKYDCKYNGDTQADYTVEKLWKDTNHTKNRPINVTVQLLKDGSVYDTVVLIAANSWKYIWNYLDTKYHWPIVEKEVPNGYTATITQENNVFTITNTYGTVSTIPKPGNPNNQNVPKTRDTSNIEFYVGLFIFSLFVMIFLFLLKKKKEKQS